MIDEDDGVVTIANLEAHIAYEASRIELREAQAALLAGLGIRPEEPA